VVLASKTGTGTLNVYITDCDTRLPLRNISLTISSTPLFSDNSGFATIRLQAGNLHTVLARLADYIDFSKSFISISDGQLTEVDFCMTPIYVDCGLNLISTGVQTVKIACIKPEAVALSPLRIYNGSGIYGIALVDVSDSMASGLRIWTSSGLKAVRKL
jgi:hypothetical protein